ncbi:MAG: DUF1127 domain-containing protein [Pseudomonadales bacterium]|uniref:YjiS-like domain-containing protein n=1 Tax=Oleiphilus messinensis TaxID=141451 RepID=A0A1Y0I7P5_9GAMM|nr:DUF1127 domain-containing protein [Oleiphilus messinensis]ARU55464.1 hypothetical protein OLMES_1387 [Oleiphilus messinensis]MCG8612383.1 DUF1127 domain-containing protein [Pseudomonadales bacterium]
MSHTTSTAAAKQNTASMAAQSVLSSEASVLVRWWRYLRLNAPVWWDRYRQRQALAELSSMQMKDIGLSRSDVINEVNKPFWKP